MIGNSRCLYIDAAIYKDLDLVCIRQTRRPDAILPRVHTYLCVYYSTAAVSLEPWGLAPVQHSSLHVVVFTGGPGPVTLVPVHSRTKIWLPGA